MIRTVFIIRRKIANTSLVFASLEGLRSGDGKIDGFVYSLSSSISREEEISARDAILADIDKELSLYMQDKSYIKRLLISAAVFLAVYFLCAFVIRDPIPMIDEIIAGLAAAICSWFMMKRNDSNRVIVGSDRAFYKKALDEAEFTYTSDTRDIEEYLDSLLAFDLKTLTALISNNEAPSFDFAASEELKTAFDWYIRNYNKLIIRYAREITSRSRSPIAIQKSMLKDAGIGLLDTGVLSLYLNLCC